jgi:hypothetical protein
MNRIVGRGVCRGDAWGGCGELFSTSAMFEQLMHANWSGAEGLHKVSSVCQKVRSMKKIYRSNALAVVHEMMKVLHEAGSLSKQSLGQFDRGCLVETKLGPKKCRAPLKCNTLD